MGYQDSVAMPLSSLSLPIPHLSPPPPKQVQDYVRMMSAASGIPFLGWPVPVLWRKIGSRSFLAQLESHGQDWHLAYTHGESETVHSGRPSTNGMVGGCPRLPTKRPLE